MRKIQLIFLLFAILFNWSCSESGETIRPDKLPSAIPENYIPVKREYWPTRGWKSRSPERAGLDKAGVQALDEYLFSRQGDEENREGIRTDGVVIIKDGYLVYERYARGFTKETPHLSWSVAKSFVNAFYGIAVKDELIRIEESAGKYYTPLNTADKKEIRVSHLLEMSSGLYWDEGYESSPLKSSVIAMLYTRGRDDMAAFAAAMPVAHEPGKRYYYSSGTTNILMKILQIQLKDEYESFPWQRLFNPLGIESVVFEKDGSGNYVGSSYLYATPRDLAKFGFLYLNDGLWEDKRILPEGWVRYSTTMAESYYTTPADAHFASENAGAQWWLNFGIPQRDQAKPMPNAPRDTFCARGHWGQSICVVPSYDIVMVRTGDDRDKTFSLNEAFRLLSKAMGGI